MADVEVFENAGDPHYTHLESEAVASVARTTSEKICCGGGNGWRRMGSWVIFACALIGLSLNLTALGYDRLCVMSLDKNFRNGSVALKIEVQVGWKTIHKMVDTSDAGRTSSHTSTSAPLDCDSDPDDTSIEDDKCGLKLAGKMWLGFGIAASAFAAAGLLLAAAVCFSLRYGLGTGRDTSLMMVLGPLLLIAGALVLASVVIYALHGYSELKDVAKYRPVLERGDMGGAVKEAVFFATALGTSWWLALPAAILLLVGGVGGHMFVFGFAEH